MSREDFVRWEERYLGKEPAILPDGFPLPLFAAHAQQFPTRGLALEIACGRGETAVWFALQGMRVFGSDIAPTAIAQARELAATLLTQKGDNPDLCRFEVHDLDNGLPDAPPVDLLICNNFRNPQLYRAMEEMLAPGGLLAVVTLSEVGASPGRFRAKPGELQSAFSHLETIIAGEGDGRAWLLGKRI